MPKGVNSDGSKKTRPAGSGRKAKRGKKITPKLQQDVIDILQQQANQAEYIEQAIREKYAKDQQAKEQTVQRARQLEESRKSGQIDLLDLIKEVEQEKTAQVANTTNELAF